MQIILIAAMARNRVIGFHNKIPWKIPGEQKMFKELTLGHVVIMGRKTFESIGKPLQQRRNIVISSQEDYNPKGCEVSRDIKSAIDMCSGADKVFVIGGEKIYEQCISIANKIYLTVLQREIHGDTFFPVISSTEFSIESSRVLEYSEPATFYTYQRRL